LSSGSGVHKTASAPEASTSARPIPTSVRLAADRLFDTKSGQVLFDQIVEIEDGRISAVGPRKGGRADGEVIDFGDATLLPGLIDIHQHLAFDSSSDVVGHLQTDDDSALLLRMRLAAQRALSAGITTIRDLGDRNYLALSLRDWFALGCEPGPRILASGPPLTVTNGHCWFLGGEADDEAAIRRLIREHASRGVDVIKIMATGGNLTPTLGPHESQYGIVELRAAAEEAHAHGLPLAVHAHGPQGIADAVAVGADSIEHCTFFTADGVDADPNVMELIVKSDSTISMTGAVVPGTEPGYPAMIRRVEAIVANHAALYRAGARLVCSSDAGVTPSKPHNALPFGVSDHLPRIGMSNAEAIVNVTLTAAQACGIEPLTGSLEPGKDADILVVAGDPVQDIRAIHRVLGVFARGLSAPLPGGQMMSAVP
jgi:imidazolonepropionase-like amidohydrolase